MGRRVTEPHKAYTKLQKSVNMFLSRRDSGEQLTVKATIRRNILGIPTTNLNDDIAPRNSTSEEALSFALDYAKNELGSNTLLINLRSFI